MRVALYIFVIFSTIIYAKSYINVEDGEKSSIYRSYQKYPSKIFNGNREKQFGADRIEDVKDANAAKRKAEVLQRLKNYEKRLNLIEEAGKVVKNPELEKQKYHRDAVLNLVKRSNYRRARDMKTDSETTDSSSSFEEMNWKDEWKQHWLQKKLEAINSSIPKGDKVNMVAASKK